MCLETPSRRKRLVRLVILMCLSNDSSRYKIKHIFVSSLHNRWRKKNAKSPIPPPSAAPVLVMQFALKSSINVMRTDLLEKEQGVSELYRTTYVKAIMRGDGSFLVIFAGETYIAARRNVCPL